MVIAIILLTIIRHRGSRQEYRELAIITVIMCLFCAAVFVWGLKLQMKLFPGARQTPWICSITCLWVLASR